MLFSGSSEAVKLKLTEEQFPEDPALTLRWDLDAAPGAYVVRRIVREAGGNAVTTMTVTIP